MADTGWLRAGPVLVRRVGPRACRLSLRVWPLGDDSGRWWQWSVDRITKTRADVATVAPVDGGEVRTRGEALRAAESKAAQVLRVDVPAMEPGRVRP
jgi:hypothetical protein